MFSKEKISALILTGGEGRRINGEDKGLMNYQGSTLIQQQINWLKPQVSQIIISANRNFEQYKKFGFPVYQDLVVSSTGNVINELIESDTSQTRYRGPLSGLLQGLSHCATEWLFVQPVDMPSLPNDIVEQLVSKILQLNQFGQLEQAHSNHCFYLKSNKREHYLSMLISKKCLTDLKFFIKKGKKKVSDFHQQVGSVSIDLGIAEAAYNNLNFSKDYIIE